MKSQKSNLAGVGFIGGALVGIAAVFLVLAVKHKQLASDTSTATRCGVSYRLVMVNIDEAVDKINNNEDSSFTRGQALGALNSLRVACFPGGLDSSLGEVLVDNRSTARDLTALKEKIKQSWTLSVPGIQWVEPHR